MGENTKNFILDASVILTILLPDEKNLKEAKKIVKILGIRNNKFFAPRLLELEVCNSLKSSIIRKRIKVESIDEIISNFNNIKISFLEIDKNKTINFALKNNLSFYDASYLYLAKINKCKLLTLDKKLQTIANEK